MGPGGLQSIRQKYHIRIRKERQDSITKLKRIQFIQEHSPVDSQKQQYQFQNLCTQLVSLGHNQETRVCILSELAFILTSNTSLNQSTSRGLLKYTVQTIASESIGVHNIEYQYLLSILISLVYLMDLIDILPFQKDLVEISLVALHTDKLMSKGIQLSVNLSFFDTQFIIQSYCNDQYLGYVISILDEMPLDTSSKSNILDLYNNLVIDKKSNHDLLIKHFTLVLMIVTHNSDLQIYRSAIRSIISLAKREHRVIYQEEFHQTVKILMDTPLSQGFQGLVLDVAQMLNSIIDRKQREELELYVEQHGLLLNLYQYAETINTSQTVTSHYKEKTHEYLISISREIQSAMLPSLQGENSYLFQSLITFYCRQINSFQSHSLFQSTLYLIRYSCLQDVINTDEFVGMLEGFREETMSHQSQMIVIEILERMPLNEIKDYNLFAGVITRLLGRLRKSSRDEVREKCQEILMEIEERDEESSLD